MSVSAKTNKPKEAPSGPSLNDIALETFKEMDVDKSGKVSFNEFKISMEKKGRNKLSESALKDFFQSFDVNKDGELCLAEVEKLVESM